MKRWIITLVHEEDIQFSIKTCFALTFAEAATYAHTQKNMLGHDWSILKVVSEGL